MAITNALNLPRNSYTATSSQTAFAVGFEFYQVSDIKVYKNGSLMTYNAAPSTNATYSITGTASSSDSAYEFGGGGSVNFGSGLTSGDIVVIVRDIAVERTVDFNPSSAFDITTLNTQLDTIIGMIADREKQGDRSVKLLDADTISATVTLPLKATRASKILSFDADGNTETTLSTSNLSTLTGLTTELTALANVSTEIGRLGTTAAVADMAILGTSAIVADMAILGTDAVVADMAILATSAIVEDMSILGTADVVADMNVLATADVVSDMNTLGTADVVSDLNTLASSTVVTNIATVAANVAGVNSFAERYRVTGGDPGSDNDAGDLNYNTSSNALKYWDGSAWNTIASSYSIDTATDTNLTSVADGAMLLYDTGTSKWIDNVMSGDATMADTGVITIANDAVTADKIADSINSAITANTAKVTNATHSGEVTGATALTIADNVVDEANLKVSNTPTNGYFLSAQSGNTGGLTWAEATSGSTAVALTGTTDEVDWGAGDIFTHTLTADTTYTFANVPTAAAIDMIFTNFKLPFNTSTTSSGDTFDPSGSSGGSFRQGWLKPDGTKYYLLTLVSGAYHIYQFAFSTAFDVSTLSYESKTISTGGTQVTGFYIGDDGDYIFVCRQDRTIKKHPLSTAYDISTVDFSTDTQSLAASVFYNAHNRNDTDMAPRAIWFKSDGSIMYTLIRNLSATDGSQFNIAYYTLSTPWDLSTASAVSAKSVYLGNANHGETFSLSPNGDYLVMNGLVGDVSRISIYTLSTVFDTSTASDVVHIDGSAYNGSISFTGISFNASGTALIFAEDATDRIVRWELGDPTAFAVTFPSGVTDIRNFFQKSSSGAADKVHLRLLTHNGAANVVIT